MNSSETVMFCHSCGTALAFQPKFCPSCGQNLEEPPVRELKQERSSKQTSKPMTLMLMITAAIILAVGVVAVVANALSSQQSNQDTSQTLETVPFSVFNDFDAAQIQQRLINLGMCPHADSREELEKYTSLVRAYDDGTFRACTFDDGNMVNIWANQSTFQLQSRVDTSKILDKVSVTGYNWFIDFDAGRRDYATRIASLFSGQTSN